MKWIFPAVVAIVSSIGAAVADSSDSEVMRSYARARAVLDGGVAAMGGAEALTSLTSVTREFENHRTNPGQGPRPFDGAPTIDKFPIFSLTPTTSVIDYVGERFRFSQRFLTRLTSSPASLRLAGRCSE